jgi:Asp-tRNA(Asn)/Glu-tRNA(Gln) amidotransferase A subunit family amidase
VANLELLAAHARMEAAAELNAVVAPLPPGERAATGALAGVPVAIKDNIDVRGVVTTNASTVAVPPPAPRDARAVARLRAAGAELLCKTNLLEYAAGSVNPAYGMTLNPHHHGRTSGGSSSGSAALVAAGVCDYALGTDTGGSIRIPAAYCGIVGVKPTSGLVPLDGVTALCPSLDHVGTLTRTVEQAARLLSVLAGRALAPADVPRPRIGVIRAQIEDPDVTPGVRAAVVAALEGWDVVDVEVPALPDADAALGTIILYEAYAEHRERLEREGDKFGAGTRAVLELGAGVSETAYRQALAAGEAFSAALARAFDGVDVLAGPTVAYTAPPEDPQVGSPEGDVEGRFTGPYNLAGVPAVSIPCGVAEDGLPAGLQLAAPAGSDAFLLSVARELERRLT